MAGEARLDMSNSRPKPPDKPQKRRDEKRHTFRASQEEKDRALAESESRCRDLAQANLALQGSVKQFRQLFEAASDWFWEADPRGSLTYVSPNFEAMYGHKISEIVGRRLNEIAGVVIAPEMSRNALAAMNARQPFRDYIYSYQPPGDDRKRWIHTNSIPAFEDSGAFGGYRGVSRDITEQVEAEKALRESNRKFQQLYEIGSDYYWETDAQYRVSYLSPNYEVVVGVSATEALGKRLSDVADVRINPHIGKMALAAQKEKKPYRDFVYSRKLPNGEVRWFSMSAIPIFGEGGEFQGYRGVAANITARVNAEGAADLMFSAAPVPMMLLDVKAQRYADINDYAVKLLGYSREQALEMSAETFFAPHERERYRALRNVPVPSSGSRGTWRYAKADGSDLVVDVTVHPIRVQGRSMAIVALVDVTEQKYVEGQLRKARDTALAASRAKSDLLANMSHELRTPLNAIIGFSQIMKDQMFGPLGSAQYLGYTTDILESGRHLLAVINDILDLAKIEANSFHLIEGLVKIGPVVESALRFAGPGAEQGGIELVLENRAEKLQISGDEVALKRVLINLVTNAVKFSERGTRVTVCCELTARDDLAIAVKDRGIGMAPEDIPIALTPFQQVDNGLQRRYEGTGLGLPIARQLVEIHGGQLTIESALGHGTTVTVLLPASRVKLAADAENVLASANKAAAA
jgi:PAS domain S-box-containing protein